jgi:dolichyl-phosphate-mannose-protein mannosyltransferase
MLIHIYLGTQRVMYVYHYFIALILSFFILALVFKIACDSFDVLGRQKVNILTGVSVCVALGFSLYAPFSYHQPLTRQDCEARNWPMPVISCMPPQRPEKTLKTLVKKPA